MQAQALLLIPTTQRNLNVKRVVSKKGHPRDPEEDVEPQNPITDQKTKPNLLGKGTGLVCLY